MSRIRTVKPELFRHESLFDAELESGLPLRLAFIGLFTVVDCEGRFIWKPRTLKLDVLPHDAVDFAAVLNALAAAGFIERYEVDGQAYGLIPSFTRHQVISGKENEGGSKLPPPYPIATAQAGTVPELSRNSTGTVPELSQHSTSSLLEQSTLQPSPPHECEREEGLSDKSLNLHQSSQHSTSTVPTQYRHSTGTVPDFQEEEEEEEEEGKRKRKGKGREGEQEEKRDARTRKAPLLPISPDWQPSQTALEILGQQGIDEPFARACIPEFRLYWTERGEQRPGWDASFVNSVKRSWEKRPMPRASPQSKADQLHEHNQKAIAQWLAQDRTVIEGEVSHGPH